MISFSHFTPKNHRSAQKMYSPLLILSMSVLFMGAQSLSAQANAYKRMAVVDSIMKTFHIDHCCNTTISECIQKKPECAIADHLYRFADWLSGFDAPADSITKYLRIRYESFTAMEAHDIDTSHMQRAGKANAPVVIIAYISANCPSCKRYVGDLYDSVTIGGLNGKAMLFAKPYGSGIGNKALVAAAAEGTFWKLFLALRNKRGLLKKDDDVMSFADSLGIASKSFISRLHAPATQQQLDTNKKEGRQLNIKYTPTFFINGKRYSSHKRAQWVTDAVLYEMEENIKPTRK